MKNRFKTLDLSHKRRVFVVGDIHGAYSKLEKKLDTINFDRNQDHLVCTGDLIDRGKESHRVLEFLNYDWFDSVQGNHDQAAYTDIRAHKMLGGQWLNKLKYKDIKLHNDIKKALYNLPVLIEILTPTNLLIGVAHATYTRNDWAEAQDAAEKDMAHILWDRDDINKVALNQTSGIEKIIKGIDHIFYGHNPLSYPVTIGNQHWIDTGGCWDDGEFTIVEIT